MTLIGKTAIWLLLKTVDSQLKITDFAFSKPELAQPNTMSRPQDISDQKVPEIVDNDGNSAPLGKLNSVALRVLAVWDETTKQHAVH